MKYAVVTFAIAISCFLSAGLPASGVSGESIAAGKLPPWRLPKEVAETPFEFGADKGAFAVWGRGRDVRHFFPEFLPALFERTLVLSTLDVKDGRLEWIFTGERGGFTVTVDHNSVGLYQRFYDSPAFNQMKRQTARHAEWAAPRTEVRYEGRLQAVTVRIDHRLSLSVELNGKAVVQQQCLLDVSRQQLKLIGAGGKVAGKMLQPQPMPAVVRIDPAKQHQTMLGFGGIATPTAYAQLSGEGKQRWWELLREYNLLIQREYPIGTRLSPHVDNWDHLEDATPHYYGDNFPNGEISDFDYIRTLRGMGGKVWFEFWALPPWVGADPDKYAGAIVRYCQVSKEKVGAPPDVVGIQNEVDQSASMFHQMTLALRRRLDEAGFKSVKIHMSDSGTVAGGIKRAEKFRGSDMVWASMDYSATHMYDYQRFFADPDGFDARLAQWKQLTADKPFLSTELCINDNRFQWPTYRVALTMGQLYHKNLVLTDAVAICYCWTLLNVVQPSYGWTRTLCVPDREHGFVPVASSHQLRVFGAYSRRIREGMVRVEAQSSNRDLLACAFQAGDNSGTVVLLNRSTRPQRVTIQWPGVQFTEMELVDPYHENEVRRVPMWQSGHNLAVDVGPGAVVTISNAPLGRLASHVTD